MNRGFLGKRLLKLSIPTILLQAENLLTEAIHCSGTNSTAELRLQHADGSWRDFEVVVNNLMAEPSVAGIYHLPRHH